MPSKSKKVISYLVLTKVSTLVSLIFILILTIWDIFDFILTQYIKNKAIKSNEVLYKLIFLGLNKLISIKILKKLIKKYNFQFIL